MRKIISVLVFVLFCAVPLWAQDEYDAHLVGHVLDERTGEHLPYVNVQVKGTDIGTVTDESGHFFLKKVHLYKQYCLEISCGVKNILDQFQRDIDRGEFRDANYIYGPTIPRTWFAGLSLKL